MILNILKYGLLLIGLFYWSSASFANPTDGAHSTDQSGLFCGECHTCDHPSIQNPCLRTCPRHPVAEYDPSIGPETCVLNEIEDEYEPVIFAHKLHAEMSAMGHGCTDCHHYSDPGNITACRECHPRGISAENLKQPGLKGAYHRQCMACHTEWAHETACEVCHVKKGESLAEGIDTTAPRPGRRYAKLEEPKMKVWESTYGGGTIVTLHHGNHTKNYGIECAACHHAEGCASCHDQSQHKKEVRHTEVALHGICNACHEEMSCERCHLKEIAPEFSHDQTGWPLDCFHAKVECKVCHGNPYHFTKPSSDCSTCHLGWEKEEFDHGKACLNLDEIHIEIDCVDCHVNRDFSKHPKCNECHDPDITFPGSLPGHRNCDASH